MTTATLESKPIAVAESGTPAWLEARYTCIGSSDAAAACGLSEYATPLDVYLVKRREAEGFCGNRKTRRGTHNEPFILREFAGEFGVNIDVYPMPMFRDAEHAFIGATPDAQINGGEGLEIKDIGWRMRQTLGDEGTDDLPASWVVQAQQQMRVMGWDVVHFAVMCEDELLRYRVERNERLIEGIVERESELWDRIVKGDPPDPDFEHPATPGLLKGLYGSISDDEVIGLSEASRLAWATYEDLGGQIRELEKHREAAKARVVAEIGEHLGGDLGDGRFVRRSITNVKEQVRSAYSYCGYRAVKVKRK